LWLGKQDKIVTCGFTKTSDREFGVYDPRALKSRYVIIIQHHKTTARTISTTYNLINNNRLSTVKIDNSTSTPLLFFDEDTDVLFLSGRGASAL